MSEANELAEEVVLYLSRLNVKQQKAVLETLKSIANRESSKTEKTFAAEMKLRLEELETGKVKALTFEELASEARRTYSSRKRKRH